jgi:hypothetical protein
MVEIGRWFAELALEAGEGIGTMFVLTLKFSMLG